MSCIKVNYLEVLAKKVNESEVSFLTVLAQFATKPDNLSEIFEADNLPHFDSLLMIFHKPYYSAQKKLCELFIENHDLFPDPFKLLMMDYAEIGLDSLHSIISSSFIILINDLLKTEYSSNVFDFLKTGIGYIIKFYCMNIHIEDVKIPEFITRFLTEGNGAITCSNFIHSYIECCSENSFYRLTNLIIKMTKSSLLFCDQINQNNTLSLLMLRFIHLQCDSVSQAVLLEDFCTIIEIYNKAAECFYASESFIELGDLLRNKQSFHNMHVVKFITCVLCYTPDTSRDITTLLEFLIASKTIHEGWENMYLFMQTILYILTFHHIADTLFTNELDLLSQCLELVSDIILKCPHSLVGQSYQMISHVFSLTPGDTFLSGEFIFNSLLSPGKIRQLICSPENEQQKAGFLLILTTSSYEWSAKMLCDTSKNSILNVLLETSHIASGFENLNFKNDILTMFIKNSHIYPKLDSHIVALIKNKLKYSCYHDQSIIKSPAVD